LLESYVTDMYLYKYIDSIMHVLLHTYLAATTIYNFCQKAIETAELSIEDWYVETVNQG
jgi:hypothetical protein